MSKPARPLLLKLGGVFAVLYNVGASGLLAAAVAGIAPYLIDGQRVTREEWLRLAAPLFVATVLLMAVIAIGIFAERPWSRHLVMAHWAAVGGYGLVMLALGEVQTALAARVVIQAGVAAAFSAWYFYRKPNVVDYFDSLRPTKR